MLYVNLTRNQGVHSTPLVKHVSTGLLGVLTGALVALAALLLLTGCAPMRVDMGYPDNPTAQDCAKLKARVQQALQYGSIPFVWNSKAQQCLYGE